MTCDVTRCPTPAAWEFRWLTGPPGVDRPSLSWHYCPRHAAPHLADPTAQKRRVA